MSNWIYGSKIFGSVHVFFHKAIACFYVNEKKARQEQDRDRLYQVFAFSSAGQSSKAEDILRSLD